MSRSRRKNPYLTEGQDSSGLRKERKRLANKRVRNNKNVTSGNNYKKISESWDICDFKFLDKDKGRRK